MPALPASLALTTIPDGALEIAADPRNNFTAAQTAVNALIADFSNGVVGQLLAALSSSSVGWVYPPGYEIAYDQITAGVNIASTAEGTPTTIIAGTSHVYENIPYLFHFFCNALIPPSTTGGSVNILLLQDGVSIGRIANAVNDVTGGQGDYPAVGELRYTPTAGAHTFAVAAFASVTTGTPAVQAGAGGASTNVPAFLRATKA